MEIEATYVCLYCFQMNVITIDGTGGLHQKYIEECQICCRPNNLVITIDEELKKAVVYAETA